MTDYHDYIGKKIRITTSDKKQIDGIAISYSVGMEEDKDYDSLGIQQIGKGYITSVPIPDIAGIKVIEN